VRLPHTTPIFLSTKHLTRALAASRSKNVLASERITISPYEKEPCAWKFFEKLFKFGNFFIGVTK